MRTQRLKVRTLGAVDRRVATGAMEQPPGVGRGKGCLPRGAADGRTLTQRWSPEWRIHSHKGSEGRGGRHVREIQRRTRFLMFVKRNAYEKKGLLLPRTGAVRTRRRPPCTAGARPAPNTGVQGDQAIQTDPRAHPCWLKLLSQGPRRPIKEQTSTRHRGRKARATP